MALTLKQLKERVRAKVATSASDELITAHLNEAYYDLAKLAKPVKEDASLVTVAGQRLYACPGDVFRIIEARLTLPAGQTIRLAQVNPESLPWPEVRSQPWTWFLAGSTSTASGTVPLIGLYPTPSDDYSGLAITLRYVYRPAALAADTDVPVAIPESWHHLLTYYACWQLAIEDDPELSRSYQEMWVDGYNEAEREAAYTAQVAYVPPSDVLPRSGCVM